MYGECWFTGTFYFKHSGSQNATLKLLGREFHMVAAATTTELSPAFTCVRPTVSKLLFAERNAHKV